MMANKPQKWELFISRLWHFKLCLKLYVDKMLRKYLIYQAPYSGRIYNTFVHRDETMWHAFHDDVIKWKHFPRYWPFGWRIHRSPVNSPHKRQWRGSLMFSLICAWINNRVNNRETGDLRPHRSHYDVIVMLFHIHICMCAQSGTLMQMQIHFLGRKCWSIYI